MNNAYLLTGTNLGDRLKNLARAEELLDRYCGRIEAKSSIYETEAWGFKDQPDFLNRCIHIQTKLNPRQLIRKILKCEKEMGRVRDERLGPRIIDIDILLYENEVCDISFLRLPHPEMQNRRFALTPLNEIAPHLIHPVFNKTISELLNDCPDPSEVCIHS